MAETPVKQGVPLDPVAVAQVAGTILAGYLALRVGDGIPSLGFSARDAGVCAWAIQVAKALMEQAQQEIDQTTEPPVAALAVPFA